MAIVSCLPAFMATTSYGRSRSLLMSRPRRWRSRCAARIRDIDQPQARRRVRREIGAKKPRDRRDAGEGSEDLTLYRKSAFDKFLARSGQGRDRRAQGRRDSGVQVNMSSAMTRSSAEGSVGRNAMSGGG